MIEEKLVQVKVEADCWQDAIRVSCGKLLELDMITSSYIESIFANIERYGMYFILLDKLALPHSSTFEEVRETGLAITTLKNPIDMKGKQVQVLMTLASTSHTSHLGMLQELSEVLQRDNIVNKLIQCNASEEIVKIMEER
ncbi:MAG: PTS sugar transporter subunit IIA [Bacilli bacterium]